MAANVVPIKKYFRRVRVPAWACECSRCGRTWTALEKDLPRACPACRSGAWSYPFDPSKPGRRPRREQP
jgi:hypothetical protein